MTAETPPDRRPLATFLQDEQGTTNDAPSTGSGGESPVASDAAVAETVEAVAVSHEEENAASPAAAEPQAPAATRTAAAPQFLRGPRPREALDAIAGCSNTPDLIADLRERGLGKEHLPCERIEAVDRDGKVCRPGDYSLTEKGRRMVHAWISKRRDGGHHE